MGISLRSQLLFCLVWVSRYMDIFTNHYSIYNTILKIVYLATSFYTIYLVSKKYRSTYDKAHDTLNVWYLIIPCIVLCLIFCEDRLSILELGWTFSLFLEAVAILPQIWLLRATGEVENLNSQYIFCLGLYRALYLVNWIYRYCTEEHYYSPLVWVCGSIQTLLYVDYFYYYIKSRIEGTKLVLP